MAGIQIDGVNNKIDFDDDQDTSISANTDDTLVIEVGTNTLATFTSTSLTINDGTTIITNDNSDTLTLQSADADGSEGPVMVFDRASASPADDDVLGAINFRGKDSGGNGVDYVKIQAEIMQESDGSEDGQLQFNLQKAGTSRNILTLDRVSVVINEDSQDIDFRVESNSNTHMLFVEGGTDRVGINASSPGRTFTVGGDGIIGLEGSSNAIAFTDSSTLRALISSQSFGPHDGDGLGIATQTGEPIKLFTNEVQRIKITSDGVIGLHHAGSTSQQVMIENQNSSGGRAGLIITNPSSSAAMNGQEINCVKSNSSAYSFLICRSSSSGTADTEINLRGDGEVFADGGTAMNQPADYAEMFEWKDGNTDSEVRFGYSVILDGDKIVKASDSDDASKIIGVVSAKPAVLGDAAWGKWSQKYLKDEWNQYVREEYTSTEWVEVKDGENINHSYETDKIPSDVTVPSNAEVKTKDKNNNLLTRRKLNPEWDSSKTYTPRQERKEWDAVGLMGKLRLRKGQPTGTNWIKMRDISDSVEEWLVR